MEMNKGQVIRLEITDVSDEGKGFGRAEGLAIFVNGALPGDVVDARVTRVKKRFASAEVVEVVEPSPFRRQSECPYSEECGGCSFRELDYDKQLELKAAQVRNKLSRIGGVQDPVVRDTVPSPMTGRYRNKGVFAVRSGHIGFYKRGSHDIADIEDCQLLPVSVMAVINEIRKFINNRSISCYDGRSGKGFLREVTVKCAFGTGQMMVVLTGADSRLPHAEALVEAMDQAVEDADDDFYLASVVLHVNRNKSLYDFSDKVITIAGSPTIVDEVEFREPGMKSPVKYEISPLAFYQVNPLQMKKLCTRVHDYARPDGNEILFDLYCGIGTMGLPLADRCRYIVGIETVKSAVVDANRNAVINGIVNARYYRGKAEEVMPGLMRELDEAAGSGGADDSDSSADALSQAIKDTFGIPWKDASGSIVILDPPRKGCDPDLLASAASTGADRIVYVSCDPGTMARDVARLREQGYDLVETMPFDMFPWTTEIECVSVLKRR